MTGEKHEVETDIHSGQLFDSFAAGDFRSAGSRSLQNLLDLQA